MQVEIHSLAIVLASILDLLIGDPWGWLHPVQVMGWLISWWRNLTFAYIPSGWGQKISGICLNIFLLGASAGLGWGMVWLAYQVSVWLGLAIESILLASCMAGRSLRNAAIDVLLPLEAQDMAMARSQLSKYVGRDTENLDQSGILRGILETVAENTTDGAIAPLFFALIGGRLIQI
jgi:adenosylcobinamide-phosphate synthase